VQGFHNTPLERTRVRHSNAMKPANVSWVSTSSRGMRTAVDVSTLSRLYAKARTRIPRSAMRRYLNMQMPNNTNNVSHTNHQPTQKQSRSGYSKNTATANQQQQQQRQQQTHNQRNEATKAAKRRYGTERNDVRGGEPSRL